MPTIGRPRSGTSSPLRFADGRVSDYVKITGRYPPRLAAELRELAAERREPLWGILASAAEAYLDALPVQDRARVMRRARSQKPELARAALEQYERNLELKARTR